MSTSFWLDRTAQVGAVKKYDVVVVGAGISGLSTCYWLQKEDPSLKIALVEKHRIGFGASGRNAGFITCGSVEHFNRMISKHGEKEAIEIWSFAEKNLELLKQEIILDKKKQLGYEEKGSYSLAAHESELTELKKVSQFMNKIGIATEVYNSSEIEKRVGAVEFAGGIKYLGDASTNPIELLKLMKEKLKVDIYEQTEVNGIQQNADTRIVRTDGGNFECSMVILTLNGYSANLHPYFKDKIHPTRGQILMMDKIPPFMDGPCYANFYLDYFRQIPSGELLIGGFRQIEKETEVGFSDHVTDKIQNALHDFVIKHLPQFRTQKVTHRWAGIMGFSNDGQPLIGSLPDDGQVFFCGGYTGHGIGLAFHTAKTLVDLIFGREVPRWISARRF